METSRIFLMAGWLKAIIFYGPWVSFTSHGTAKRKPMEVSWLPNALASSNVAGKSSKEMELPTGIVTINHS